MTKEEAISYGEDYYKDLITAVCGVEEKHKAFVKMAIEALQERKTGKWIDHSEDGYGYVECPICGYLTTCEGNIYDLHYCFWCGARMEVEDADRD